MPRIRFAGWRIRCGWLLVGMSLPGYSWAVASASGMAFQSCLNQLAQQAPAHQLTVAAFHRYTTGLQAEPAVLAALDHQPEFSTPIWDYLSGLVDAERVSDGRAALQQHAATLQALQQRYGVDPAIIVAVWGVESNFGRQLGHRPLLQSLATLACEGRRQAFFRGELYASVRILEHGDIQPEQLNGSWAGAFGQTQFMPTTFERVAVDFDGDGRRDLVASADDALASTAHYLALAGWHRGEHWGWPVRLPRGYQPVQTGRQAYRPLAFWREQGLQWLEPQAWPPGSPAAALLQPAGADGQSFLVLHNFNVIYSYNASISYSLAIALLADQLQGRPAPVLQWPTTDLGTSRAERRQIQARLLALGYPLGAADGMIGDKTREAILAEQRKRGLPLDGRAGQRTLQFLRVGSVAGAGAAVSSAAPAAASSVLP